MNIVTPQPLRLAVVAGLACALFGSSPSPARADGAVKTVAGPHGGTIAFARAPVSDPIAALHGAKRAFASFFQAAPAIVRTRWTDRRAASCTT